jgi:hypothetical protein
MTYVVANAKGRHQKGSTLPAGCDVRISELLALRIEKHLSDGQSRLYERQQHGKKGNKIKPT